MPMQDGISLFDGVEDGRADTPPAGGGLGVRPRPYDGAGGDDADVPVQRGSGGGCLQFIGQSGTIGLTCAGAWCTKLVSSEAQMSTAIESGYRNSGNVGIVVVIVLIFTFFAHARLFGRSGEERHAIDPGTVGNGRPAIHGDHSPQTDLGGARIRCGHVGHDNVSILIPRHVLVGSWQRVTTLVRAALLQSERQRASRQDATMDSWTEFLIDSQEDNVILGCRRVRRSSAASTRRKQ